ERRVTSTAPEDDEHDNSLKKKEEQEGVICGPPVEDLQAPPTQP
ncbi:uncharacterized, partial [Tachysurus ichikawai]